MYLSGPSAPFLQSNIFNLKWKAIFDYLALENNNNNNKCRTIKVAGAPDPCPGCPNVPLCKMHIFLYSFYEIMPMALHEEQAACNNLAINKMTWQPSVTWWVTWAHPDVPSSRLPQLRSRGDTTVAQRRLRQRDKKLQRRYMGFSALCTLFGVFLHKRSEQWTCTVVVYIAVFTVQPVQH